MNKNIAMLIVAVLLFAMALIAVNQFSSGEPDPTVPAEVTAVPEVTGQVTEQTGTVDAGNPGSGNGTMSGGLMPLDNGTLRELPPVGEASGAGALADPHGLAGVQPGEEEGPLVDQPGLKPESHKAAKAVTSQSAQPAKAAQKAEHKPAQKDAPKATAKAEAPKHEAKPAKTEAAKAAPAKAEAPKKQAAAPVAPAAKAEAAPAAKAAPKAAAGGQTAKASIKFEGSTAVLHLEGASGAQYKSFVLKEPDRMVVDLVGAWTVNVPAVPSNRVIKAVRVGKPGEKTRIVLDLDKGPDGHEVVKKGGALEVRVK